VETDDVPLAGHTNIDRLAEAARRILDGESAEEIARQVGCPLADVRALADQLVDAGLAPGHDEAVRAQWAPWFSRMLRGLFVRRHAEPGGPEDSVPWSAWQPLAGAPELEARTCMIRNPGVDSLYPLWAYEIRSLSLFTVSFRYRVGTEPGIGFPRRVRGLRPGEFYGGMTVVPSPQPPGIDAELVEQAPGWPEASTAEGP
jgi:hypothetical protein